MQIYPNRDSDIVAVSREFEVKESQVARILIDGLPDNYRVVFEEAVLSSTRCGNEVEWILATQGCCCDSVLGTCAGETVAHIAISGKYRAVIVPDCDSIMDPVELDNLALFVRLISDPNGVLTQRFLTSQETSMACPQKISVTEDATSITITVDGVPHTFEVANASTSEAGIVQLATGVETGLGDAADLAVTPAGLLAAINATTNELRSALLSLATSAIPPLSVEILDNSGATIAHTHE